MYLSYIGYHDIDIFFLLHHDIDMKFLYTTNP